MPHSPNTLFDPTTLAEAFPDAVSSGHIDGIDPHRTPYEELGRKFSEHQMSLGIAAQAGVSVDTATAVANLMNTTAHHSLDSLLGSSLEGRLFAETAKSVHRTMDDLLRKTGDVFALPGLDSPEFKNTNWQRLHEATKAYEQLGIESAVVFAPINRPLDGTHGWRTFFSGLRQWQDKAQPNATNKLQNQNDGDGLWINSEISDQWDSVIDTSPSAPQWQVSVVPVTDKAPVVSVAHDGTDAQGNVPPELQHMLGLLPPTPNTGTVPKLASHPKAESLLTIHAMRHFEGKDPIDGKIGGSYYWSWAEGTINNGARGLAVHWSPGDGRVYLYHFGVGSRGDLLGVRPEVRG